MIADRPLGRDDFPFAMDVPLTGQRLLQLFPRLFQPLWSHAAAAVAAGAGSVTQVNAGYPATVSVTITGHDTTARYLAGYTPTVGDAVLVLRNAEHAIVIGKLA